MVSLGGGEVPPTPNGATVLVPPFEGCLGIHMRVRLVACSDKREAPSSISRSAFGGVALIDIFLACLPLSEHTHTHAHTLNQTGTVDPETLSTVPHSTFS